MTNEEIKIARALVACGRWRWMPGMRAVGRKGYPAAWFRVEVPLQKLGGIWRDAVPDITDPATLGCILQLVRDAHGDPSLSVTAGYAKDGRIQWEIEHPHPDNLPEALWTYFDTEAEALLRALQAAPEVPNGE